MDWRGVRGLTSNPSIFQKAIQGSAEYDQQFTEAIGSGLGVEASYWELVTSDISAALDILRPVYDQSEGLDGYVSVEVDPGLARDSAGTEASAAASTNGSPHRTSTSRSRQRPRDSPRSNR